MNSPSNIPNINSLGSNESDDAALKDLDVTLRMLSKLPAPAGIEDRVFAGVLARPRKARVLEWPRPLYARDWVRSVAAAAIVLAIGGGGWGIYAHVEQNQPAQATVAPRTMFRPGGFSSAEMIRRPQTLKGPVVKKTEPASVAKAPEAELMTVKKPAPKTAAPGRRVKQDRPSHARSSETK